jgi:hypothetical protein
MALMEETLDVRLQAANDLIPPRTTHAEGAIGPLVAFGMASGLLRLGGVMAVYATLRREEVPLSCRSI